jgi:hypothetical protein
VKDAQSGVTRKVKAWVRPASGTPNSGSARCDFFCNPPNWSSAFLLASFSGKGIVSI